jgi:hypothetical protein
VSGKFALIIGNTEYTDPGLAQLTAPGKDARAFGRTLDSTDICAFDDVSVMRVSSLHFHKIIDELISG